MSAILVQHGAGSSIPSHLSHQLPLEIPPARLWLLPGGLHLALVCCAPKGRGLYLSTQALLLVLSMRLLACGLVAASASTSYSSGLSATPALAARAISPTPSGNGLPPPRAATQRQTSVSPTPRRQYEYTVALRRPIVAPDQLPSNASSPDHEPPKRIGMPKSFSAPRSSIESTFFHL